MLFTLFSVLLSLNEISPFVTLINEKVLKRLLYTEVHSSVLMNLQKYLCVYANCGYWLN